eukprot:6292163-Pyramimonas_sp.AAC.1
MTSRGPRIENRMINFRDSLRGCGGAGGGCEHGSGSAQGRERSGSRAEAAGWRRNSSSEEYEPLRPR